MCPASFSELHAPAEHFEQSKWGNSMTQRRPVSRFYKQFAQTEWLDAMTTSGDFDITTFPVGTSQWLFIYRCARIANELGAFRLRCRKRAELLCV
jgi:hypothetical protein